MVTLHGVAVRALQLVSAITSQLMLVWPTGIIHVVNCTSDGFHNHNAILVGSA
jgi:hypothetical protein